MQFDDENLRKNVIKTNSNYVLMKEKRKNDDRVDYLSTVESELTNGCHEYGFGKSDAYDGTLCGSSEGKSYSIV